MRHLGSLVGLFLLPPMIGCATGAATTTPRGVPVQDPPRVDRSGVTLFGARVAALQPRDEAVDQIYGTLPRLGVDLRHRFAGHLSLGVGLEFSRQEGEPIVIGSAPSAESEISIVSLPFTLHINSATVEEFRTGTPNVYAGFGISVFSVEEELRVGSLSASGSESGTGLHLMLGADLRLGDGAYLSPFVRVSSEELDSSAGAATELGGVTLGIDIGVVF
jgi:hypothetical protein